LHAAFFTIDEGGISIDGIDVVHGVEQSDNEASKNNRMKWAEAMWQATSSTRF
jgi:hypothetical protein